MDFALTKNQNEEVTGTRNEKMRGQTKTGNAETEQRISRVRHYGSVECDDGFWS